MTLIHTYECEVCGKHCEIEAIEMDLQTEAAEPAEHNECRECFEKESTMDKLIFLVEEWSKNKGLDKADSSKQFLKVVEEIGEVAAALARKDEAGLRDGIGDVVVTLIILAQQNDMDLYECLNCAYDEIKGRTGQMVDGVFVKSEDL